MKKLALLLLIGIALTSAIRQGQQIPPMVYNSWLQGYKQGRQAVMDFMVSDSIDIRKRFESDSANFMNTIKVKN